MQTDKVAGAIVAPIVGQDNVKFILSWMPIFRRLSIRDVAITCGKEDLCSLVRTNVGAGFNITFKISSGNIWRDLASLDSFFHDRAALLADGSVEADKDINADAAFDRFCKNDMSGACSLFLIDPSEMELSGDESRAWTEHDEGILFSEGSILVECAHARLRDGCKDQDFTWLYNDLWSAEKLDWARA